jgi:LmbE family N-acetylglucosaminyl deacetylase
MMRPLTLGQVRRALIVAPHPDDETIGCAGLILRLRRRGVPVTVMVVTDGGASHRHSRRFPHARLVRERAQETRRAVGLLGISAAGLRLLALPDGGLDSLGRRQRARLTRAMAQQHRADLVAMPLPDDAHPDHRDTARACIRRAGQRRLGYGVWPKGRAGGPAVALPLGADLARKRQALAAHVTQLGRITDDPTGFTIDPATARRFLRPAERYRWL